jgi:ParB-like chromosome segregation protein Spo0J
MNFRENMAVAKLTEHPENRKLFKDISDTNPAFWLEFIDSVKTFGVLEPLIVNKETKYVRSGNQRLKAAVEVGLETVPVLLIDDEDTDDEIAKMIASNVYRRTIDPFAMFEYIGRLRGNYNTKKTRKKVHKDMDFISAAEIFNNLPDEHQEALKEWFGEQAEGEKAKTQGELIAQIREMEADLSEKELQVMGFEDDQRTTEEQIDQLETLVRDRDVEIGELRDEDLEDAIADKESQINKLLTDQAKLKKKIKELQETPDLNVLLVDCISKQKSINAVLKEIVENAASLNLAKLNEFQDTLKRTIEIAKKGVNHNDQNGRRKGIE